MKYQKLARIREGWKILLIEGEWWDVDQFGLPQQGQVISLYFVPGKRELYDVKP